MKPNELLRQARIRLGLSEAEAAVRIKVSQPCYYDLEEHEDEITSVYSIAELFQICHAMALSPHLLFEDSKAAHSGSLESLVQNLKRKSHASKCSLDDFGLAVGWDITNILQDGYALMDFPVIGLIDVCRTAGSDWHGVLADLYKEWNRRSIS